jgi:predicted ATP-binding protein involved in virulence
MLAEWIHQPAFAYSGIAYIADSPIIAMAGVPTPNRQQCLSFIRPEAWSQPLLQAITNLKLQSAMDSMSDGAEAASSRSTRIIRAIENTLSEITGFKFRFQVTSYPTVSIWLFWGNRSLPFNLLPDGLRSIIGWLVHAVVMMDTWLQGKNDPQGTAAVFLLDEIESHLHPAWQRKILPAFQRLFPKAQIFITTHSPFVIASLTHGWIHQLTLEPDGRVTVRDPKAASAGDSYISVVEDIMGVKEWYDPESEKLLADFRVLRDAAYRGDAASRAHARSLAVEIGKRSMELDYLMGKELKQMDHQLSGKNGKNEEVHQA